MLVKKAGNTFSRHKVIQATVIRPYDVYTIIRIVCYEVMKTSKQLGGDHELKVDVTETNGNFNVYKVGQRPSLFEFSTGNDSKKMTRLSCNCSWSVSCDILFSGSTIILAKSLQIGPGSGGYGHTGRDYEWSSK